MQERRAPRLVPLGPLLPVGAVAHGIAGEDHEVHPGGINVGEQRGEAGGAVARVADHGHAHGGVHPGFGERGEAPDLAPSVVAPHPEAPRAVAGEAAEAHHVDAVAGHGVAHAGDGPRQAILGEPHLRAPADRARGRLPDQHHLVGRIGARHEVGVHRHVGRTEQEGVALGLHRLREPAIHRGAEGRAATVGALLGRIGREHRRLREALRRGAFLDDPDRPILLDAADQRETAEEHDHTHSVAGSSRGRHRSRAGDAAAPVRSGRPPPRRRGRRPAPYLRAGSRAGRRAGASRHARRRGLRGRRG